MSEYNDAPSRFSAYNSKSYHFVQFSVVVVIVCFAIAIPIATNRLAWTDIRVFTALVLGLAFWAVLILGRARDNSEQLVIDTNGIYVRSWHLGPVSYEKIDFIAMSQPGMRKVLQSLLHNRRGAYVIASFNEIPPFQPSVRPPWSYLQRFWVELDSSDPVISPQGLDTDANAIMAALQDHIGYWREQNPNMIIEQQ